MPPKSTSSPRPPARGGTARNEWSTPRKTQISSYTGPHTSDNRHGYSSYSPDHEADADRRRSYTLTFPGMETLSGMEDEPEPNDMPAYAANLQNGSHSGDNRLQQPFANHGADRRTNFDTIPGKPASMLAADEDARLLASRLDPAADEEAVPIGRETAAEFDPHAVWRMVLSELALQMPSSTYDTWVRDTVVIGYEDGEFIIGMPNAYARDWLENRLRHTIKRSLSSIMRRAVQIQFRVRPRPVQDHVRAAAAPLYQAVAEEPAMTSPPKSPSNLSSQRTPVVQGDAESEMDHESDHELEIRVGSGIDEEPDDLSVQEVLRASGQNGAHHPVPMSGQAPGYAPGGDDMRFATQLNPYHTFDTFVVGNHNRLAHAAALAIVDTPGHSFNPLFIYGGVGLGKTHLLNAIGNSLRQKGFRMIYCSSEQFTNELISSIRNQSTDQFRTKYRQADVLLIDDIQFIGGKESTQEEFFHTFNHLHAAGKQVVLSSDRPPKALPTLDDRLRSRFEGGLQTDIAQPDFETRVAILQSKANRMGVPVPYDVLLLVAERVDSNIRELEGALNRLSMQARLTNQTLSLILAKSLLENLAPQRLPCPPAGVVRIVAEHFGLRAEDLTGRKRTKEIAGARQIAMYLLREENDLSLPAIGDQLGGRDHSTIRYGVERVAEDLDHDEGLRMTILALRDKVYAPPVG
ncbi:MAG: chromosomal replication initiator protein DnaA [Caldilineaceae bacterium]|nr:chromosomal replication initiator protein DnaA [Caldilineaceae bacterium]